MCGICFSFARDLWPVWLRGSSPRLRSTATGLFIRPDVKLPEYRARIDAFRSSWDMPAGGRSGAVLLDEVHDGTAEGVCRVVARLMNCRRAPRTWFVFDSRSVMTILTQLAHFRARPGKDVHLLSRDFDPYFEWFRPGIAHYRGELLKYEKSLARIIRNLLEGRQPKSLSVEVSGEFVAGDSLGTL